jgi:ATP-binding cassette, subfamily F, member 3
VIRVENLRKSFANQDIFTGISWFLGDRDRVGLIGRNGTGKSTLLKILAGQEFADGGETVIPKGIKIGYLPQFGFETGPGTVLEESRRAFQSILDWRWEREEIEARLTHEELAPAEAESLLARHEDLDARFRHHGGYEIERQVHQVLTGLGFHDEDLDRPVRLLSGGWQMRVALARLLLARPDVLLLDEPTNQLDIEARVWLERFLTDYPGGFVIVSHDRWFLDHTVTRITEIQSRGLADYDGSYSKYLEQREVRYEIALKAYRNQQDEIAHIQRFIDRNRVRNDRAAQVQSRIRMLEKLDRLEPPVPPARAINFRFPQPQPSGRIVVRLRGVAKSYGPKEVFRRLDLDIERGEKVALVGPNGAGKSTLMRIIAGREAIQAGERELGLRVDAEFFAQDEADRLPTDRGILEETIARAPTSIVPQMRSLLGAFLFSGDEAEKRIGVLSGGERNRLALMYLLLKPANLLMLDEPTNHLDIVAQEVLLRSLKDFTGTVIFVSHDHFFLEGLATRVVEVGNGGIRIFPGDYESYLWKKEQEAIADAAAAASAGSAQGSATGSGSRTESRAQKNADAGGDGSREVNPEAQTARDRGRMDRRRLKRLAEVEGRITLLEDRRVKLEDLMSTDGFFKDPEKSRFYVEEHRGVVEELARLYDEWHTLSEEEG